MHFPTELCTQRLPLSQIQHTQIQNSVQHSSSQLKIFTCTVAHVHPLMLICSLNEKPFSHGFWDFIYVDFIYVDFLHGLFVW